MGRLLLVLATTLLAAAEPEPLSDQGAQAAAIHHALQALTRGDAAPLAALPAASFRSPIGITAPDDAALVRRWTAYLPQALERAPAPARGAVLQSLDALFLAATAGLETAAREAQASCFLPAPAAVAVLAGAADRHFDRGELASFLACAAQLRRLGIGTPSLAARSRAACTLAGLPGGDAPTLPLLCVPPPACHRRRRARTPAWTIPWRG